MVSSADHTGKPCMDAPMYDAFEVDFNRDRFRASDFKPNFSLSGRLQYDIPQTLQVYEG